MQLPRISIITPSFNQSEYLERTIKSVINQNYSNLEYIIIDGGSSDSSLDILREYDKNISYWISEKDKGQADALNKGLDIASGEIIGWINSDDMYCKDILETVGEWFKNNSSSDVLYGGMYIIDKDDNVIDAIWASRPDPGYTYHGRLAIHQQSLFWRKNIMKKAGRFDDTLEFVMDLDFIIRLQKFGNVNRMRKFFGMLRRHPATKTTKINNIGTNEGRRVLSRYSEYFNGAPSSKLKYALHRVKRILFVSVEAGPRFILFKLIKFLNKFLPININETSAAKYLLRY